MTEQTGAGPAPAEQPTTELQPGAEGQAPIAGVEGVDAQPENPDGQPEPQEQPRPTPQHRTPQYRFSEMSRQIREAEQTAAYWRGVAEGKIQPQTQQQAPQPQTQQQPAAGEGRPDPNDPARYPLGELDSRYVSDLAEWAAERKWQQLQQRQQQTSEFEQKRTRFVETFQNTAAQGFEEGAAFLRDVGRVPELADAVVESEYAPVVAEYFAHNPDHWAEVANMAPTRRAVEIDRIGSTVSARLQAKAATPRPQAPAPTPVQVPQTLQGRGPAPTPDISRMDFRAFEEAFKAGKFG